jgi:hypothetical protein
MLLLPIYHISLIPLVLLTGEDNSHSLDTFTSVQKLSRFKVASREFKDEIEFGPQALPGHLTRKWQLASVYFFFA